jgi:hypothetical protein
MKILSDLAMGALAVWAALVAFSTPAAAQPADPATLPSEQPAGPAPEVIAAYKQTLTKTITDLQAGHPDYDTMAPQLADVVRAQIGAIGPQLQQLGAIKSVDYDGVYQTALKFKVTFANGETNWMIVISPDGKIGMLVIR